MALALDLRPDLILELGRLYGNSTCAFTEAANMLGPGSCRVTSLCLTDAWANETVPRLLPLVGGAWFAPLDAQRADILTFDYNTLFDGHQRVLVFWDAHGFGIAECVLGRILPLLQTKPHIVAMHDMADIRYLEPGRRDYGGHRLWRGNDWGGTSLLIGNVYSKVEQAVAVVDFTSRNHLLLESASHTLASESTPAQLLEIEAALGLDARTDAGWYWFSLHSGRPPWTFPHFHPPSRLHRAGDGVVRAARALLGRLGLRRALSGVSRRVTGR